MNNENSEDKVIRDDNLWLEKKLDGNTPSEKQSEEPEHMIFKDNTSNKIRCLTNRLLTKHDVQVSNASSPTLIGALIDFHQKLMQEKEIIMWISNLERLFLQSDKDMSGDIDNEELKEMVSDLDVSDSLKSSLYRNFSDIEKDNNGAITLRSFLTFFLLNSKFIEEVLKHAGNDSPWQYVSGLTNMQKWRLHIYKITQYPGYNTASKVLFCVDLISTCVPVVILFIEGLRPSFKWEWDGKKYMWVVSMFFAFQYICGFLTCKSKTCFVSGAWNTTDMVSFIIWILSEIFGSMNLWNPAGFIVFRTLRIWKLHRVFDLKTMKEELELYTQTMNIFWTSYRSVIGFLVWTILFFSVLIYVFERGEYDEENAIWTRDEDNGSSPFSDMYNCIYFNIAAMTTLGYGNHYPESYIGKFVALMSSCMGIVNLTFLINIIS